MFFNSAPASFRVIQVRLVHGVGFLKGDVLWAGYHSWLAKHTNNSQGCFVFWLLLEEGDLLPPGLGHSLYHWPKAEGHAEKDQWRDLTCSLQTAPPQPGEQLDHKKEIFVKTFVG